MKVTQYVPAFIELDIPRFEGEMEDLAALTALKWMERWWSAPGFYQFSCTLEHGDIYLLLAEFAGGKRYYVVARLEGADVEAKTRVLPAWNPQEAK